MRHTLQLAFFITIICIPTLLFAQWTRNASVPNDEVLSLLNHNDTLYAGTTNVVYRSTDNGNTWSATATLPIVDGISVIFATHNRLFAGTLNQGVFVGSNGGTVWQRVSDGLNRALGGWTISGLACLGDSLYAATMGAGVFVMNLRTLTGWTPYNENLLPNVSFNVSAILARNDTLFIGAGANGNAYRRGRSGSAWETLTLQPNAAGLSIGAFATVGNELVTATSIVPPLFRSRDNGATWTASATGLQGGIFPKIAAGRGVMFYASNSSNDFFRLFGSIDGGNTWQLLTTQFNTQLNDMMILNDRLLAARNDGLFSFPLSTLNTERDNSSMRREFRLEQNYPNPFNPSTVISYELPAASEVSLKIYDVLGRETQTLVNARQDAGRYSASFNATNLSSGIYFYRLQASAFSETRKMMLVK